MYLHKIIDQIGDWDLCDRFLCYLEDFTEELYSNANEQSSLFCRAQARLFEAANNLRCQKSPEVSAYLEANLYLQDYKIQTIFLCALRNGLFSLNCPLSPEQEANIMLMQSPHYQPLLHESEELERVLKDWEGFAQWQEAAREFDRQYVAAIIEHGTSLGREMEKRLSQPELFVQFLRRTQRPADMNEESLLDNEQVPEMKSPHEEMQEQLKADLRQTAVYFQKIQPYYTGTLDAIERFIQQTPADADNMEDDQETVCLELLEEADKIRREILKASDKLMIAFLKLDSSIAEAQRLYDRRFPDQYDP